MMNEKDFKAQLFQKYVHGECTEAEVLQLLELYKDDKLENELKTITLAFLQTDNNRTVLTDAALDEKQIRLYQQIERKLSPRPVVRQLWKTVGIAATLLVFTALAVFFLWPSTSHKQYAVNQVNDAKPGRNQAVLTLGNGRKIVLTTAQNGNLAKEGNIDINKTADGQIVYQAGEESAEKPQYNTMTVPRGGQYHLTLADGTNVWLNAQSSIRYPNAFAGGSREVEVTGETYFEVTHDAARPFRVIAKGQTVEVLGTHFNINAYDDEPAIKTTLLEGKVKVYNSPQAAQILKPGEEANNNTKTIAVMPVDAQAAVAWKNNQFQFVAADLRSMMRQFARWYDLDVSYQGNIPDADEFTGKISRNVNASVVFAMLKKRYGIDVSINGRTVIVKAP